MTSEQLNLLRKGRFVELSDNETYAISTENDFETFDLINMHCDSYSGSDYFNLNINNFNDNFENIIVFEKYDLWQCKYDINKIATDINFKNIIWERKEQ